MMVWKNRVKKQAMVIEEWRRKDMIMMAPVTQCWQEGARGDGSGDRTESGQVNILVKPVLTS